MDFYAIPALMQCALRAGENSFKNFFLPRYVEQKYVEQKKVKKRSEALALVCRCVSPGPHVSRITVLIVQCYQQLTSWDVIT